MKTYTWAVKKEDDDEEEDEKDPDPSGPDERKTKPDDAS